MDEFDVRQMKKALNRLGYYRPFEKVGITGMPDKGVFEALKSFQADHGLLPTGEARPGDKTVQTLSEQAQNKTSGKYIWRTADDDKVRDSHAELNGTVRDYEDSPDPGEEFNCRCWADDFEMEPGLEPVYPELMLLPFLKAGRLFQIWRAWILSNKKPSWRLGDHKSPKRWANQLNNRKWTPEQITETIQNGKQYPAPNRVNPGNGATRYEYNGRYIVKDDVTNEILQISGEGFIPL